MKAKITKRLVDSVAADKDEVVIWDTDIPGFGFKVTATGRKTYFLYYRTGGGRQRKPTIGQHGELTAEQARSIAKKWAADAALGGDISGTRKAERRANTIEQLADRYLEEYAQLHKKAISVEADRSAINNHITPLLGSMKIKNVTRADVEQLKLAVRNGKTARRRKAKPRGRSVVRGGPIIANRVIAVLSKMFACAMDWGLRNDNPARGVKKFKEGRKDRFLDADEIARLLNALDLVERIQTESQFAIAALRVLLFSGLRRSEVCDLRWKHVNLERGFIRLEDSKTGGRTVPINRTVIDIFNNLPRDDDDQAHVFLSDSDDGRLALTRRRQRYGVRHSKLAASSVLPRPV